MQLSKKVLEEYANSRVDTHKSIVCHAPFVSLNFEQNGDVRACCYNYEHILGKWPEQSINEIWKGEKANELRAALKRNDFSKGCNICGEMLNSGNYSGVRARFYDEYAPEGINSKLKYFKHRVFGSLPYPKVMEFELSNKCNLECIMCNGDFSSAIRRNREKLPPLQSPYDDTFVDELEEFIPHLTDAKFLGGEPFMIEIYLKIWERIRKLNPKIRIHITTNGTFLTDRVKNLLEGLNAGIILSTDAVNKETYDKIRINGQFDKVMKHLDYFIDYAKRKDTFVSMAVCPILSNWQELPEILDFCLDRNISLYFNTVVTPEELSLKEQPVEFQEKVIEYLKKHPAPYISESSSLPEKASINAYNDFIKQLESWVFNRKETLNDKSSKLDDIESKLISEVDYDIPDFSFQHLRKVILEIINLDKKGLFEKEKEQKEELYKLLTKCPKEQFSKALLEYLNIYIAYKNVDLKEEDRLKVESVAEVLNQLEPQRNEQVLRQIAESKPLLIAEVISKYSLEEMMNNLSSQNAN